MSGASLSSARSSVALPVVEARPERASPPSGSAGTDELCIALVGNPNSGKTTLFNRLTGLRAKTANFPGTTIEARRGRMSLQGQPALLLDLPGLYGFDAGQTEERLAAKAIAGDLKGWPRPAAVVVVVDATRVGRQLYLVSQVLELGVPVIVALNMIDVAEREGRKLHVEKLSRELGVQVVPVSARSGRGLTELLDRIEAMVATETTHCVPESLAASLTACTSCSGCPFAARHKWASDVEKRSAESASDAARLRSDRLDRVAAHPWWGLVVFSAVTTVIFVATFWLAAWPMEWIETAFAALGEQVTPLLPAGDFQSLVVDGIIGGVGGVLVFLPQICILFFLLSLLEDTGYLARAALVMDRLMSRVGLPGRAFVPMLTAHACAIPAIMSTRVIDDRRDRLLSILVIPLMTCSARLPVYAMVVALLFASAPILGGVVFAGAYLLGILAVFVMTFIFRRTILPGKPTPLVLELPDYRLPSLRTALLTVYDRGWIFLRRAGTIILFISICLWFFSTYPKLSEERVTTIATADDSAAWVELEQALASGDAGIAEAAAAEQEHIVARYQAEYSALGRLGRFVEPVFQPLGFDWKINVGVLSSFAARETIVSTLAIVHGIGEDGAEETKTLTDTLRSQRHPDGGPVFTMATSLSLLVFFVLAMQCLPTQAVTSRETGNWKWAAFQLAYMTVLAYTAALVTYQTVSAIT